MLMPMMNIRPMRMAVNDGLMPVCVAMVPLRCIFAMLMAMMCIPVVMAVLMTGWIMGVGMDMLVLKQDHERNDQDQRRSQLKDRQFFTQKYDRHYDAEKGRTGKYHLASCGPELLGRLDVKRNAVAIGECAYHKGRDGHANARGMCFS